MDFLKALLSQGWGVGSIFGIIGVVLSGAGVVIAVRARIGARLVYQLRALGSIEREKRALPEEVEILFEGRSVPRVMMTYAILWNSGRATVYGENIVADEPLRLEFSEGAEVLRTRILRVTNKSNDFTTEIAPDPRSKVICSFDYLDANDGATIEILHTDKKQYPKVRGRIRGVPKGVLDWGRISEFQKFQSSSSIVSSIVSINNKIFPWMVFVFGIVIIAFHLPSDSETLTRLSRIFGFVILILAYSLPVLFLWVHRRRFPKSLIIEDIER